jgi:hypothetical protein
MKKWEVVSYSIDENQEITSEMDLIVTGVTEEEALAAITNLCGRHGKMICETQAVSPRPYGYRVYVAREVKGQEVEEVTEEVSENVEFNKPIRPSSETPSFMFCGIVEYENETNPMSLFQDTQGRKFVITAARNYIYVSDVSDGVVRRV